MPRVHQGNNGLTRRDGVAFLSPKSRYHPGPGGYYLRELVLYIPKIKLAQLQNPSTAELAAAQEAVTHAQTELSTAQAETNQAIAERPSVIWQILLQYRISLQANKATLDNPALSRGLTPAEIADAEEAVAANQEQISNSLKKLRSASLDLDDPLNTSSLIPEKIRTGLWAESEALEALETARAELRELQNPEQDTLDQ